MKMAKNPSSTTHGIEQVIFGLVDDDGQLIADPDKGLSANGLYSPTMNYEGATTANWTGLEQTGTDQFANDQKKRRTTPAANPSCALTFLDIGWKQKNKITGYVQDANDGGWSLSTSKPHVAMLTVAKGLDGSKIYEGCAKGTCIDPQHQHQTDNTAEVDADAAMTYSAEVPDADVFKTSDGSKQPYRKWSSADANFSLDQVFAQVFPGFKGTASLDVEHITAPTSGSGSSTQPSSGSTTDSDAHTGNPTA
jgi:hypothetical protein